jgi:hypothetical protein
MLYYHQYSEGGKSDDRYSPSIHLSQQRQNRCKLCIGHLLREPPSAEDPGDNYVLACCLFSKQTNDGTEVSRHRFFIFKNY